MSIAYQEKAVLLIPYGIPNEGWDLSYDLGWAHGGAGSGQFFAKLYELTKDEHYLVFLINSAEGIMQSGWPGKLDSLFGESAIPIDQRFGLAGIVHFLLDCSQITEDTSYAVMARQMADEVLAQAKIEEKGIYWSIPACWFMGEKGAPKIFTGYFYGAHGYGSLFLKLYQELR